MCDFREDAAERAEHPRGVAAFVDELVVALANSRIYGREHPRVRDAIENLARTLETQFRELGQDAVVLGAADGYLFFDHRPLLAASRSAPRLLEILARLDSGGITFHRGGGPDDLAALLGFLGEEAREIADVAEANRRLEQAGCGSVRLLTGYEVKDGAGAERDFAGTLMGRAEGESERTVEHMLTVPVRLHRQVFDHLTDVTMRIVRGDALDIAETRGLVEAILGELLQDAKAMLSVTHYELTEADQFQFRHSIRVACLALQFARHLTQDIALLHRVGTAALLHDVGKARVPFEVLHSQDRLSPEEFAEMAKHPEHGAHILLEMGGEDGLAAAVAFMHHRTTKGAGYPRTLHHLEGTDLSRATRVVKVCDVYEALTGYRPYRDPISPVRAYRTMISMGDHFDRSILHAFIRAYGIYPVGSWVELASGEAGRVEAQTDDLEAPVVVIEGRLVASNGEQRFEPEAPDVCDLRAAGADRRIVHWVGNQLFDAAETEPSGSV